MISIEEASNMTDPIQVIIESCNGSKDSNESFWRNPIKIDAWENYYKAMGHLAKENVKKFVNIFRKCNEDNDREVIINYIAMGQTLNRNRGKISDSIYKKIDDNFIRGKMSIIDMPTPSAIAITGNNFTLIELCMNLINRFYIGKLKVEKIFLFKNKNEYDCGIPLEMYDDTTTRQDGLIRLTSLNLYDEGHYRDISNLNFSANHSYIVIDSDLFFYIASDLSEYMDRRYISPYSWIQKVDAKSKYWLGSAPLFNNREMRMIDLNSKPPFVHCRRGIHYEKIFKKYLNFSDYKELENSAPENADIKWFRRNKFVANLFDNFDFVKYREGCIIEGMEKLKRDPTVEASPL